MTLSLNSDSYYTLTCIMSILGKHEKAFEALEQAVKMGYDYNWMQKDEDLAPLRAQTERWKALMKKHFPDKFKD